MKASFMALAMASLVLTAMPALSTAAPHGDPMVQSGALSADLRGGPAALPLINERVEPALIRVAHRRYKRHYHGRSHVGRHFRNKRVRSYHRRHHMRTPGHYTYRDFPTWAARALEPARTR